MKLIRAIRSMLCRAGFGTRKKGFDSKFFDAMESLLTDEFCELNIKYQRSEGCRCNCCWDFVVTITDIDDRVHEYADEDWNRILKWMEKILHDLGAK